MVTVLFSKMYLEDDHSPLTNRMLGTCGVVCILHDFIVARDRSNIILSLWKRNIDLIFLCLCIVNIIPNYNQQDATFLDLFISTDTLHVSGGSSAHHQEHKTVHTASGVFNHQPVLLAAQQQAAVLVDNT